MLIESFRRQIDDAIHRVDVIRASAEGVERLPVLSDALLELSVTMEELQVAYEELQSQSERLIDSRAELHKERERYRQLFESAPDGYLVTDSDGRVEEANRAASAMLDVGQRFLIGRPLVSFLPEMERPAFRGVLSRLRSDVRIEGWEVSVRTRDEFGLRHLAVTAEASAMPDDARRIIRWAMRDVTPLKKSEAMVREMDSKLWVRVVERTAVLTHENERLRDKLSRMGAIQTDIAGEQRRMRDDA